MSEFNFKKIIAMWQLVLATLGFGLSGLMFFGCIFHESFNLIVLLLVAVLLLFFYKFFRCSLAGWKEMKSKSSNY